MAGVRRTSKRRHQGVHCRAARARSAGRWLDSDAAGRRELTASRAFIVRVVAGVSRTAGGLACAWLQIRGCACYARRSARRVSLRIHDGRGPRRIVSFRSHPLLRFSASQGHGAGGDTLRAARAVAAGSFERLRRFQGFAKRRAGVERAWDSSMVRARARGAPHVFCGDGVARARVTRTTARAGCA